MSTTATFFRYTLLDFVAFWKQRTGKDPEELIFDSRLTIYGKLHELNQRGIQFMTLRRRSPAHLLGRIMGMKAGFHCGFVLIGSVSGWGRAGTTAVGTFSISAASTLTDVLSLEISVLSRIRRLKT